MHRASTSKQSGAGTASPHPNQIYQLKIELKGIRPPIWRRLYVADDTPLPELHRIFQAAMGWWDGHLHAFYLTNEPSIQYSQLHDENRDYTRDEDLFTLRDLAPKVGSKLRYEYDFGDSWEHVVTIEKAFEPTPDFRIPFCVKGRRACPPEDVGGTPGYEEFLEAIADLDHPQHKELLEWAGGEFEPEKFDLESVNTALQCL